MIIYAARHGQTPMNARNEVSGVTDVDLNETGIAQARELAEKMKSAEPRPELIICSSMIRAEHTAGIVAAEIGVPLVSDDGIREQNYGIYEGKDRFCDGFLQNKSQFAVRYPGGESMFDTCRRVYNFLDRVTAEYYGKTVLIVAHGGILRILRTYFTDMTNSEFFNYNAGNAEYETYTYLQQEDVK